MHYRSSKLFAIALAAIGLSLTAQPAKAAFISPGISTESLGSFSGSLGVGFVSTNEATLTISLTNTSPVLNGGKITAFVFNNPNNAFTIAFASSTLGTFATPLTAGNNQVSANPFGSFDYGVSTGGAFGGGGSPAGGLAVGATATWVFSITGTGAGSLADDDFLEALNTGANSNHDEQFMAVRFKGFVNGGSDKVGTNIVTTNVVPAPAGLILLASAVPVLAFGRLIRRKRVAALIGS